MQKNNFMKSSILVLTISGLLAVADPAPADKPPWAGGGGSKSGKHAQKEKHSKKKGGTGGSSYIQSGNNVSVNIYFGNQHRNVIHNFYTEQYRSGHCPPGLAKKNNGCMPPGHAKKWRIGRPLPRDLIFHDLPSSLIVQLGPPPAGHRFVRVASDILLITVGTGMVVDAIPDLGRY